MTRFVWSESERRETVAPETLARDVFVGAIRLSCLRITLLSAPDVLALHERRGASACALLLGPHEQVDGDIARRVLLDVLAIRARLARPVLTLPSELGRGDEAILVLEVRGVAYS
jgi:hypothetical protein